MPLTFEQPPRTDVPTVPTREEIADALRERRSSHPAAQSWAIVLRCDRAARAAAAVERITSGKEYGAGFEAVARRVGPEHRVYARFVGAAK